jgi:hypothetical protein
MGGHTLALDSILSATFHFTAKWSFHLQSNKARDLLRYLVCRLYNQGRGNLINAQLELAQTTVARKLGMSRQWVGELTQRLEEQDWIEHSSSKLPDGTNTSTVWRAGRQLKRLIIMLVKSNRRKNPIPKPAKSTWHFSPPLREKKILAILQQEKEPPNPKALERWPLLKTWLLRGRAQDEETAQNQGTLA